MIIYTDKAAGDLAGKEDVRWKEDRDGARKNQGNALWHGR